MGKIAIWCLQLLFVIAFVIIERVTHFHFYRSARLAARLCVYLHDGLKVGDFTKGSIRAIKETAKSGGSMRRGDSESYSFRVGDFSKGASASVGKYTGENKERLGAAGGSTLGIAVGAVALGPIGLVAGSILGAKAGAKAFASSKESPGPDEQVTNPQHAAAARSDIPAAQAVRQPDYLLDDSLAGLSLKSDSASSQHNTVRADPFQPNVHPQPAVPQRSYQPQPSTGNHNTANLTDDPLSIFSSGSPSSNQPSHQQLQQQAPPHSNFQQAASDFDDPLSVFASTGINSSPQPSQYQPPTVHSPPNQQKQEYLIQQQPMRPQTQYQQYPTPRQTEYPQPVTSQYSYHGQQHHQQQQQYQQTTPSHAYEQQHHEQEQRQYPGAAEDAQGKEKYHFGDVTRSIIAKGKKKSGRSEQDSCGFYLALTFLFRLLPAFLTSTSFFPPSFPQTNLAISHVDCLERGDNKIPSSRQHFITVVEVRLYQGQQIRRESIVSTLSIDNYYRSNHLSNHGNPSIQF